MLSVSRLVLSLALAFGGLAFGSMPASAATCVTSDTACVSTSPCLVGFQVNRYSNVVGVVCQDGAWLCAAHADPLYAGCVWLLDFPYDGQSCLLGVRATTYSFDPVGATGFVCS